MASKVPGEDDLGQLAVVLAAYQAMLDQAKAEIRALGFAPTARVKTTATMIDKLRRTPGMKLSRMQDVAGARIVVRDLAAQNDARDKIGGFFEYQGRACRVVDRREDPRFGYKAVHVIAQMDGMPLEVQIRTELQDAWAQIVERLADRWGRGIRYGEDPENPEARVKSGELETSRRGAVDLLMELSDALTNVENERAWIQTTTESLNELDGQFDLLRQPPSPDFQAALTEKIPADLVRVMNMMTERLTPYADRLDPADREVLTVGADANHGQLLRAFELWHALTSYDLDQSAERLQAAEQRLRDILQLVADATDEGP